jgi:hypothetical protein
MTARTAPAKPVGQARAKAQPKAAPKKTATAVAVSAEKVTYSATGRGGVRRTATSTGAPLVAAVDARIANRRASHFAKGAVIAFYSDASKAQAAADKINAGEAGPDWTGAVVVKATPVTEAVSA